MNEGRVAIGFIFEKTLSPTPARSERLLSASLLRPRSETMPARPARHFSQTKPLPIWGYSWLRGFVKTKLF
ncbi:hypothetical protein A3J77_01985 [Candidatus Wolfebacteria bacterium RBG_13_41_7]|uniref:Uncharacterized protein n=1 Tax=Candidatus Wolfebacteria bacterium RBG_13_41_7 TaxID=1802554 RepID=A0A1F8DN71_9BACT|nr:MAG: hypothetical protein A3J77_01985 [Candidatus Wolfebacteria bacterium RBG_13_41_7]